MKHIDKIGFSKADRPLEFIRNIEIVYSIGKEIGGQPRGNIGENYGFYERMQSIYQAVRNELNRRDQYYAVMGITTSFEQDFIRKLHVRIFLESNKVFDGNTFIAFIDCFTSIFKSVVAVDKN